MGYLYCGQVTRSGALVAGLKQPANGGHVCRKLQLPRQSPRLSRIADHLKDVCGGVANGTGRNRCGLAYPHGKA